MSTEKLAISTDKNDSHPGALAAAHAISHASMADPAALEKARRNVVALPISYL